MQGLQSVRALVIPNSQDSLPLNVALFLVSGERGGEGVGGGSESYLFQISQITGCKVSVAGAGSCCSKCQAMIAQLDQREMASQGYSGMNRT